MVNRLNNYLIMMSIATATLVSSSCTKSLSDTASDESVMLFGVESTQTKVNYDGVEADFEKGDELGLYAFYNNFYYYYNEYASFAESVIFANHGLTIDESKNATYSPLRTWTFSTLYGTAPHTLDVVAYYPFKTGYNEDYVVMVYDEDDGAATLEYYYVNDDGDINNVDYMTACTRYDYSAKTDEFREAMLGLEYIPLSFTRQTASLNFKITKPEDYETEIIVKGVEVTFDAYKKMTQTIGASSTVTWSDMTENYSLTTSTTCSATLAETVYDYTPSEDVTPTVVDDLLSDEQLLFFPPGTEIWKIVFTLTDDGEEKEYTWHAHVDEIFANTHYTLNLELDPSRAN
ncbi:MAG: hypothetical protein R3Y51_01790 [Rikenellaceae bacterium]